MPDRPDPRADDPSEDRPADEPRRQTIGGRHGSPTVTVAFPFSKVQTVDSELRSMLAELADLVAALADDEGGGLDRASIRQSAGELAARLRDVE